MGAGELLYLDAGLVRLLAHLEVDLVLDVGANRGQFAVELLQAGYAGRIVSFEPLSAAHAALVDASRGHPRWRAAERCALGDGDGMATLHVAGNSESSSLLPMLPAHEAAAPASRYVGSEVVPLRRLDDVARAEVESARRAFLKIDVQGAERRVLNGAAALLPAMAGIQVELDLVPMYEGSALFEPTLAFLGAAGFSLYRLRPGFTDHQSGRLLQVDAIFFREPRPGTEAP